MANFAIVARRRPNSTGEHCAHRAPSWRFERSGVDFRGGGRLSTPERREERELVEQCLEGDPRAWEEFIARYGGFLDEAVRRTFRNFGILEEPLIDDIVQDALVDLLKQDASVLRLFDWSVPLRFYVCRVAIHRAVDYARRQGRIRPLDSSLAARRLQADFPSSGNGLERSELEARIRKAMQRITPRERLALTLSYWDGLSAAQIGEWMGLQQDSARSLLGRARARLKEYLKGASFLL